MSKPADLHLLEVAADTERIAFRTPIKFGGRVVTDAVLFNVTVTAETLSGRRGVGEGSMPLGNVWSWPTRQLSYDQTLAAMKELTEVFADLYRNAGAPGHPVTITHELERGFPAYAAEMARELSLSEPIPRLCALVCASPFDAALHDAFGKAHGLNCYRTYGTDLLRHDLGRYLGREFAGERLGQYVSPEPKPSARLALAPPRR